MKREEINIRDPFLLNDGDMLYMYGSTDKNIWGGGECFTFSAYKTTDLENFEGPFVVFDRPDDFWADRQFWAPEVHAYKGKYYMFASFYKNGIGRRSQILESDSPLGPFVPKSSPFTPLGWDCLDATFFIEDGAPFSIFSHEWAQIKDGTIELVRLKEDLSGPIGSSVTLFKASDAPWVRPISYRGKFDGYVTDGPYLRKLNGGKLLMIWSSYTVGSAYAVGMAVSDSGKLRGPWRHLDEPLFAEDGGHACLFEYGGKLLMSIHRPNVASEERPNFFELEEVGDRLKIKGLLKSR